VRKRGFEPLRPCERHPLKMVRLPVSPLPQGRKDTKSIDSAMSAHALFYFVTATLATADPWSLVEELCTTYTPGGTRAPF